MKKVILLACVALLGIVSVNAQLNWGVKAGFNASDLSNIDTGADVLEDIPGVSVAKNYKPCFHLGVMAQYMCTPQLGIETGLYYSLLGAKREYKVEISSIYAKFIASLNPSYLQLPVSLLYKFELGTDLVLYPSAGIYLGYGLGGKYSTKFDTNMPDNIFSEEDLANLNNEGDFFDNDVNHFDFGATFGLNLQYSNYVIGLGYDLGLSKVIKKTDVKNSNLRISLGYFF